MTTKYRPAELKTGELFNIEKAQQGYYMVKGDSRYFVSKDVSEPKLEQVANRVLSEKAGWGYWVDFYHGLDVHGNQAWANVDQTDRFI